MFGIDSSELAIVALVALLVIGPKDLPRVMRYVGNWLAKGRAMSRHVRAGFDTMMREAEMEELQKQWAAQNEAIMKATALPDLSVPDYTAALTPDLTGEPVVDDVAAQSWTPSPEVMAAPVATPPKRAPKPRPTGDAPAAKRKRAPRAKPAAVEP
jgi:sec-independent protein translocase protein TatB